MQNVPASPRIWLLPDSELLPDWVATDSLSLDEIERLDRTRHPVAREHFRRGRLLVRSLIAMSRGCHPKEIKFTMTADGKPEVEGLYFNVSHTAGLVGIVTGAVPVGIDVESEDPQRDIVGLVNRFFAIEEREQFARLPEPLRTSAFLRGWTCKEALLKGIGSGVRDLQNCAVCLDPDSPPRVVRSPDAGWKLTAWQKGNISIAVATKGDPPDPCPIFFA